MIQIKSLSKSYKPGEDVVFALQNVTLSIEEGDIYGIIGQSGAGKSTLIRCLARLVNPSQGKIVFQGIDITQIQGKALRDYHQKMGMIFQHFNLMNSRTVAGNIAYPLEIAQKAIDSRVDELLGLVGLLHKKEAYPAQLSGGEKQRVGIARALANHPALLICDEATSALDPKTTQEILELLKLVNKNLKVTIVLITHEMEVVKRICNKVAVIEKGQIIEAGSVTEVFANPQQTTTKHFIQSALHEIPPEFFKSVSSNRKLLRLRFKGDTARQPNISYIVKKFDVEANILLGWIDNIQNMTIGTLVIELMGTPEGITKALLYFTEKAVHYEELKNEP